MTDQIVELGPMDWTDAVEQAFPGDETQCAAGSECCHYNPSSKYPTAAPIGTYLRMDPETTADVPAWASPWYWKSTGPIYKGSALALCEDCAMYFTFEADDPTGTVMFQGSVDSMASWFISIQDRDNFAAWVAAFGWDHGMLWENELGIFPTVAEALASVNHWVDQYLVPEAGPAEYEHPEVL